VPFKRIVYLLPSGESNVTAWGDFWKSPVFEDSLCMSVTFYFANVALAYQMSSSRDFCWSLIMMRISIANPNLCLVEIGYLLPSLHIIASFDTLQRFEFLVVCMYVCIYPSIHPSI
jgi:hypothetical protein